MYRQILEKIDGIGIYPLFSFIMFFVFFIAVTIYVIRADKGMIDRMRQLPLNNDSHNTKTDES